MMGYESEVRFGEVWIDLVIESEWRKSRFKGVEKRRKDKMGKKWE